LDTRTGYVYSAYEVTDEDGNVLPRPGEAAITADEARRNNEREAFRKLIDEFATSWPRVLERHGKKG
jgi:hypothetical protein